MIWRASIVIKSLLSSYSLFSYNKSFLAGWVSQEDICLHLRATASPCVTGNDYIIGHCLRNPCVMIYWKTQKKWLSTGDKVGMRMSALCSRKGEVKYNVTDNSVFTFQKQTDWKFPSAVKPELERNEKYRGITDRSRNE